MFNTDFPKQLGQRIAEARARIGISEARLADQMGEPFDRAKIIDIELGRSNIAVTELVCIADALETCPCLLLKGHPFNTTDDWRFFNSYLRLNVATRLNVQQFLQDLIDDVAVYEN